MTSVTKVGTALMKVTTLNNENNYGCTCNIVCVTIFTQRSCIQMNILRCDNPEGKNY